MLPNFLNRVEEKTSLKRELKRAEKQTKEKRRGWGYSEK